MWFKLTCCDDLVHLTIYLRQKHLSRTNVLRTLQKAPNTSLAHSYLLASSITIPMGKVRFLSFPRLTCCMQGATNWGRQPQAVGMAAVGLSVFEVLPCSYLLLHQAGCKQARCMQLSPFKPAGVWRCAAPSTSWEKPEKNKVWCSHEITWMLDKSVSLHLFSLTEEDIGGRVQGGE